MQQPNAVSTMLGQGHEGRSWRQRITDNSSFRSLPYFKMATVGLCVWPVLVFTLRTQEKQRRKLRLMAASLCL